MQNPIPALNQSEILLKPKNLELLNCVLAGFALTGAVFYWQQTAANPGTACLSHSF